jgi:hypothetical protein
VGIKKTQEKLKYNMNMSFPNPSVFLSHNYSKQMVYGDGGVGRNVHACIGRKSVWKNLLWIRKEL